MEFHNNVGSLVKAVKKSHEDVIRAVCEELGEQDRADELIARLLDTKYTSVKAKKDPNRVKRPKSAYLFFCAEKRQKVQQENPDKKMGDVSKILGGMWRELDEEARAPYVKMHEVDIDRYDEHIANEQ